MGKVFNKGLEEDEKEGLLNRLKNIEDKNEELLITTKSKTENIKEITDSLKITGGNIVTYDFSNYKPFNKLFNDLYSNKMTIDRAEIKQDEFNSLLVVLSNYTPKSKKYIEAKNRLLNNAKNFYKGR